MLLRTTFLLLGIIVANCSRSDATEFPPVAKTYNL
jgi:hypothetical protein